MRDILFRPGKGRRVVGRFLVLKGRIKVNTRAVRNSGLRHRRNFDVSNVILRGKGERSDDTLCDDPKRLRKWLQLVSDRTAQ